ncbi:hypothetical protein EDD66_103406 [Mobilisporobacter senegalensis]|uniref:NAD-dependent protein deacetylase, SIR2 family n=1 Tax=Mobilisporobacter senegalensis TaxID=1329262 RepID=A0A3N1XTA0_9FIRM|nr:hypothetical protein [Mobilisporobacter senegalensis]ROR29468.1 hypothetical protein EDD66_103406 [Mobilisporobacter senegalensis]
MNINYEEILELIKDSYYVLIGCGEEVSLDGLEDEIYRPLHYLNIKNKKDLERVINKNAIGNIMDSILKVYYNKNRDNKNNPYELIYQLVKDKNYFVVNMNTDLSAYSSSLDRNKIVSPCGNEGLFQCEKLCTQDVWLNDEYIQFIMSNFGTIIKLAEAGNESELERYYPKCPRCHGNAIFNIRKDSSNYSEKGYLEQWQVYMNWFQNTLNRKILMIEFGENFDNPMVIRWPFEKNTFINGKAKMIRINKKFPQIPEEIGEKSISISMSSIEFLREINKFI